MSNFLESTQGEHSAYRLCQTEKSLVLHFFILVTQVDLLGHLRVEHGI